MFTFFPSFAGGHAILQVKNNKRDTETASRLILPVLVDISLLIYIPNNFVLEASLQNLTYLSCGECCGHGCLEILVHFFFLHIELIRQN